MARAKPNATPVASIGYAVLLFAALIWAVFGAGTARGAHLGPVAHALLARDATVMSIPAGGLLPWFGLMAGLGVYAVWQCTPTARHTALHGTLRPWVLAAVLLNALWLALLQHDRIAPSLLCALALLAVLLRIVVMIDRTELRNTMDRWITRASFGLFAGWLSIVVLAEAVVWLASLGLDTERLTFKGATALVLLLLCLTLCAATFKKPMGLYLNAGALWVLAWITVDRITWQAASPLFATVATIAALLMLLCLLSALRTRLRRLLHPHGGPER